MVSNRVMPKVCSRRQEIRSRSPRQRSRAGKRARPPPRADGHGMSSECSLEARFSVHTATAPSGPNETSTYPFRCTWKRSNFYCDVEVRVHVSLRDIGFTKPCSNQSGSSHPDPHLCEDKSSRDISQSRQQSTARPHRLQPLVLPVPIPAPLCAHRSTDLRVYHVGLIQPLHKGRGHGPGGNALFW